MMRTVKTRFGTYLANVSGVRCPCGHGEFVSTLSAAEWWCTGCGLIRRGITPMSGRQKKTGVRV